MGRVICPANLNKAGEGMEQTEEWIFVFDSGLGGISVLRELVQVLPGERFLYFGDSQNAPYGTRSTEEVRSLTEASIAAFLPRGIKAIVVACNTATAAAIESLRAQYPDKIIIGMEPALKLAAERHAGGRILVMATNVTLREEKVLCTHGPVFLGMPGGPPCPVRGWWSEAGCLDTPEVRQHLHHLLSPALAGGVDAIVLGRTHFPFLKPLIQELAGPCVEILDGALGAALQTRRRLESGALLRPAARGTVEFHNSLNTPEILDISTRLLDARR